MPIEVSVHMVDTLEGEKSHSYHFKLCDKIRVTSSKNKIFKKKPGPLPFALHLLAFLFFFLS